MKKTTTKESDGIIKIDSHQMLNVIDEFCREVLELEPLTSKQAACQRKYMPNENEASSGLELF